MKKHYASAAVALLLALHTSITPASAQNLEGEPARALARQRGLTIRAKRANGRVIELMRFTNGKPEYYTTLNAAAAETSSTDIARGAVSSLTLDGSNVPIGVWDSGHPRYSHQEFGGRVLHSGDEPIAFDDHACHVTGTILASGVNPNARGMAPNGSLKSFEWNNDTTEMTAESLRLSNHSYGVISGWDFDGYHALSWTWVGNESFGTYGDKASEWDQVAFTKPDYLIVKSAGNDRGDGPTPGTVHYHETGNDLHIDSHPVDGPFDCIGTYAVAKNILTVGAVADIAGGWNQPSDVVMTSFSSWGPANDGRIKPDVCANGFEVFSTLTGANNQYGTYSGTSMAGPAACGSAAVLLNYWNQLHTDPGNPPATRSATLKGLIIHTAREAGSTEGPDYACGWGLLDTFNASVAIKWDRYSPDAIQELDLQQGAQYDQVMQGVRVGDKIKVTICWTDPSHAAIGPNENTKALVNDLDLRVIHDATSTIYYPWTLVPANPIGPAFRNSDNALDNVEVVEFTAVHAGKYIVRVTHKGVLLDNNPQAFSLFVNGWYRDVSQVPPNVSLNVALNHPATAYSGLVLDHNYSETGTFSQPVTLFARGTVTIGN